MVMYLIGKPFVEHELFEKSLYVTSLKTEMLGISVFNEVLNIT